MSRIGKQPILLPAGTSLTIENGAVAVKGPKGTLMKTIHSRVRVSLDADTVTVSVTNPELKSDRALWGLWRMLIANMVDGVTKGFRKQLELHGVGYRMQMQGSNAIIFSLGFSHPVTFPLPEGIQGGIEGNILTIEGIDNQVVGEIAARIRSLKKPEPYKGKGLRYVGEKIRRKSGKVVKSSE